MQEQGTNAWAQKPHFSAAWVGDSRCQKGRTDINVMYRAELGGKVPMPTTTFRSLHTGRASSVSVFHLRRTVTVYVICNPSLPKLGSLREFEATRCSASRCMARSPATTAGSLGLRDGLEEQFA